MNTSEILLSEIRILIHLALRGGVWSRPVERYARTGLHNGFSYRRLTQMEDRGLVRSVDCRRSRCGYLDEYFVLDRRGVDYVTQYLDLPTNNT